MVHRRGKRNRPHLYILRGLPGSRRTQLARKLKDNYGGTGVILSSFDYFRDENGKVNFDPRKLNAAHSVNRGKAKQAMALRRHPIIINNTNISLNEMKPYVRMGLRYGYHIRFAFARDSWRKSIEELHRSTGMKVPLDVMKRMKKNYQFVDNIYDVLNDRTDWGKGMLQNSPCFVTI